MVKIIFGIIFIIGGLSGQLVLRGTNSSVALVVVGVIMLIFGIIQLVGGSEESEKEEQPREAECIIKSEKIPIYSKAHESFGVMTELNAGDKVFVNFRSEFGRFYQVRLNTGETGYILRESIQ